MFKVSYLLPTLFFLACSNTLILVREKPKPNNPRSTVGEELQRMDYLLMKLKRQRFYNNKHEIMHLLHQLSGEGLNNKINPGILESVYSTKVNNMIDYQAA